MGERIVVLGGSGFIGTELVGQLIAAGHTVRIGDKAPSEAYPELRVDCDVRDVPSLRAACADADVVYNLAAEHADDVRPISLYDDVNVGGAENTVQVCDELGIQRIVFTSSVAIYGFADRNADETCAPNPFNDYGRTKLLAEGVFDRWVEQGKGRSLFTLRPTVVFGENNRGNVYNFLRQIAQGPFVMLGDGTNVKSMAYVENVAACLAWALGADAGRSVYNYIDKPDFDMNHLVRHARLALGKSGRIGPRIPRRPAIVAGMGLDVVARLLNKRFPISAIRVRKFTADSQFSAQKVRDAGFVPPVDIEDGLRRTIQAEFG